MTFADARPVMIPFRSMGRPASSRPIRAEAFLGCAHVEHAHDMVALDACGGLGLSDEALDALEVPCELGIEEFHRDAILERDVLARKDGAHAATSNEILEPIPARDDGSGRGDPARGSILGGRGQAAAVYHRTRPPGLQLRNGKDGAEMARFTGRDSIVPPE
jgi:hypothetical protein